jgi:hypothetical protein
VIQTKKGLLLHKLTIQEENTNEIRDHF